MAPAARRSMRVHVVASTQPPEASSDEGEEEEPEEDEEDEDEDAEDAEVQEQEDGAEDEEDKRDGEFSPGGRRQRAAGRKAAKRTADGDANGGGSAASASAGAADDDVAATALGASRVPRIKLAVGRGKAAAAGRAVCKVCKAADHAAGFAGSVYLDCPNANCYLCKGPGHTTETCPYRTASEHGLIPAAGHCRPGSKFELSLGRQVRARGGRQPSVKVLPPVPRVADCALRGVHSRLVTAMEFHPTHDGMLISGDKKGQLVLWRFDEPMASSYEHLNGVHHAIIAGIKFKKGNDHNMVTAGADGKLCCTDLAAGSPAAEARTLLDLNPHGWLGDASLWRMLYGFDLAQEHSLVLVGDDAGQLHMSVLALARSPAHLSSAMFAAARPGGGQVGGLNGGLSRGGPLGRVDWRAPGAARPATLVHRKKTKVVGVDCHPHDCNLFITAGNDHFAKVWDFRMFDERAPWAILPHPRVVNSAYFSPVTGCKILTTCQDNRLRVYDYIYGDLETPSRAIVHSHDFNRHLTPFRAQWDPRDASECQVVVGRYISEDFGGVALHPIDFFDISTGKRTAEVWDRGLETITPVNKLHPRRDVLASGSFWSLFIWKPEEEEPDDDDVSVAVRTPAKSREQRREVVYYDTKGSGKGKGKGKSKKGEADDNDDDLEDEEDLKSKRRRKAQGKQK
eukprot:SM000094S24724  [mRNA]  locus=s94:432283:436310:+ [translate_table: standard]